MYFCVNIIEGSRTYQGMGSCSFAGEEPAETEVAELDHALRSDEHVCWLDIWAGLGARATLTSVHHPLGVHVLQGGAQLHKVLPDRSLWYQSLLFLEVLDHP